MMSVHRRLLFQIRTRLVDFGRTPEKQELVAGETHETGRRLRNREVVTLHLDHHAAEPGRDLQLAERLAGVRGPGGHDTFPELHVPGLEAMRQCLTVGAAFRPGRMTVTGQYFIHGMLP